MRAVQKLVRNGNSTQVTILRPMLVWLGWLPGESVVVEVLEDKTLLVRKLELRELAPRQMRPTLIEAAEDPTR